MILRNNRNASIDIFRLLCAIFVVAIHTGPFWEKNAFFGCFFNSIVSRIAVPYFLAVAGYFYSRKISDSFMPMIQYLKRIVITYSVWSLFYFALNFIILINDEGFSFFAFVKDCAVKYFFFGSYHNFWFFPVLIFCVIISTLAHKINFDKPLIAISIFLFCIGVLLCSYKEIGLKIPGMNYIVNNEFYTQIDRYFFRGIPFFMLGALLVKCERVFVKVNKYVLVIICIVFFSLYVAEKTLLISDSCKESAVVSFALYPFIGMIILTLLKFPLSRLSKAASVCLVCANFTYYVHPALILVLKITFPLITGDEITGTLLFVLVSSVSIIIGIILSKYKRIVKVII